MLRGFRGSQWYVSVVNWSRDGKVVSYTISESDGGKTHQNSMSIGANQNRIQVFERALLWLPIELLFVVLPSLPSLLDGLTNILVSYTMTSCTITNTSTSLSWSQQVSTNSTPC